MLIFSRVIRALFGDVKEWDDVAWIGLSDIETEGNFVYLDGVRATEENTRWRSGQPDNFLGAEDCTHVHTVGQFALKVNDLACKENGYALCEKPVID